MDVGIDGFHIGLAPCKGVNLANCETLAFVLDQGKCNWRLRHVGLYD